MHQDGKPNMIMVELKLDGGTTLLSGDACTLIHSGPRQTVALPASAPVRRLGTSIGSRPDAKRHGSGTWRRPHRLGPSF